MAGGATLVQADTAIEGDLSSSGKLVVAGRVDGRIRSLDQVVIEASASCRASIRAQSAAIHGEVIGDIICSESIAIFGEARVVGDLRAPDVSVAATAELDGNIDLLSPAPAEFAIQRQAASTRGGTPSRPKVPNSPVPDAVADIDSRPIPLPPRPEGRVSVAARPAK